MTRFLPLLLLCTAVGESFAWTAAGLPAVGGASVLSAARDDLGRPVAAQGEAFLRDALGAVVATERGGARRLWIPDPDDPFRRPLVECDETGALVRAYLWSGGRLLGFLDETNGLVVAHCDEQGSVVALCDEAGAVLHAAAYGPFGEDWGSAGENPTPFAWLGSWGVRRVAGPDAIGPLYLTAHRLYAPILRRFLSPDPLGPAGGINPYAYGGGSPLEYIDPLGLCSFRAPFEIVARSYESVTIEERTRLGGFAQGVLGSMEAAIGLAIAIAASESGIGVAGGMAVAMHGWDVSTTGWDKLFSGKPQDTRTSHAIQSLGVPDYVANGIDAGLSVGSTMAYGAISAAARSGTITQAEYNRIVANDIANGHAYTKHAWQFGFTTHEEMAAHIERVMNNPTAIRHLKNGRTAFWDDATQTFIVHNPYTADQGTVFIPKDGINYFLKQ